MRHLRVLGLGLMLAISMVVATVGMAGAQQRTNVGQLVSGLITVNVGAVAVNIGDITVADLVDVENVLNDNEIRILNNVLNNNEVASRNRDFLNDLLRDAEILTENQVVVGVLSGQFVIQNLE
jgi:hypothetical protein